MSNLFTQLHPGHGGIFGPNGMDLIAGRGLVDILFHPKAHTHTHMHPQSVFFMSEHMD